MEKDGWLDRSILAVLGVVTSPWLGLALAFGGSALVAYLRRRGRHTDAEDMDGSREWLDKAVLVCFVFVITTKVGTPLVIPTSRLVCEPTGPLDPILHIRTGESCHLVTSGPQTLYTVGDAARAFGVNLVEGLAQGAAGWVVGTVGAILVTAVGRRTDRR